MRRQLIGLVAGLGLALGASPAWGQCGTTIPGGTLCGNGGGSQGLNQPLTQPVLGRTGVIGGSVTLRGATSGSVAISVPAAAGTGTVFQLPNTNGSLNQVLITDGSGNTSWASAGSATVSSVGLSMPGIFTVSGSPVTSSGTLTASLNTQNANLVWAGPSTGPASAPTFRSLVGGDLPNPSASTLGGIESYVAVTHQWINTISTSGVPSSAQPAFSDISGQATLAQLPSIGSHTILSNVSGGSTTPLANSPSAVLDTIAATQGDVLYRNATQWVALAPGTSGQVLTTAGAAANPTWSATNPAVVATIAALKALTTPANNTVLYVQGYTSSGDGGEGWFVYNSGSSASDNGGTIIAPTIGSGRYLRSIEGTTGQTINVKWFGAKGDGSTSDTTAVSNAMTLAIAVEGALYFPATPNCYLTTVTIPNGTSGLRIIGDAKGAGAPTALGSVLCNNTSSNIIDSTSSDGTIGNITIEHLQIYNLGSGSAISSTNNDWFSLSDCLLLSSSGTTLALSGFGIGHIYNTQIYGSAGTALAITKSSLTNSGPATIIGGEIANEGGTATNCIVISGQPLSVTFIGNFIACQGANMVASVTLDGDGVGTQVGTASFIGLHSESSYNTSNTGMDFRIGATHPFGSVTIQGFNGGGGGNGTNYQQYGVRVYAANDVTVTDSTFYKGGSTFGYNTAAIRLESTFPTSGNTYDFSGIQASTISGAVYSDANSRCTSTGPCQYSGGNGLILDNLSLGTALPPASGGLGGAWTTYVPTLFCGSGSLTTSSASGRYLLSGKTLFVQITATITTVGSCASSIAASLPGGNSAKSFSIVMGHETGLTGSLIQGYTGATGTTLVMQKYDGALLLSSGTVLQVEGSLEVQ